MTPEEIDKLIMEGEHNSFTMPDGRVVKIGDWVELDGKALRVQRYRGEFGGMHAFVLSNDELLTLTEPDGVAWYGRPKEDIPSWFEFVRRIEYAEDLAYAYDNGTFKIIDDIYKYLEERDLKPWKSDRADRSIQDA